jgi:hypothetical protein
MIKEGGRDSLWEKRKPGWDERARVSKRIEALSGDGPE